MIGRMARPAEEGVPRDFKTSVRFTPEKGQRVKAAAQGEVSTYLRKLVDRDLEERGL